MATRNHITDRVPGYSPTSLHVIRWTGLLNGDVGDDVTIPEYTDYSVHVFGTFGVGGSVQIEGTNEVVTPTNRQILNDSRGGPTGGANKMVFTAAALAQGLEAPVQMRPNVTAGDGTTSLTVIVSYKKAIF